jgi:UDP-glucose:(heptosyl)LPS alpha-1,3-glucosyltransferase
MRQPADDGDTTGVAAAPIVFIRQRYAPFGGGEVMLQNIVKDFRDRRIPVAVMSADWPQEDGIEFIRCAGRRFPRSMRATSFAGAVCRKLPGLSPPPMLVQSNDRVPCCDVFRAGEGVHAAYLAERRRFEPLVGKMALSLSMFHRETLRLERRTYRSGKLKAVIAISKMVSDDIMRHYDFPAERIHHIANGIPLDRFNLGLRDRHRAEIRARLKVPLDRPVILFVGSGFERKGLAFLIKSVAELEADAELWVVGHDSRAESFRSLADKVGLGARLKMLGPQKDVLPWYGAADAAALPSIYDPFGTVVIEAMASGLPTVVSTGCGASELVERFDRALICDVADKNALSLGLRRALQHSQSPQSARLAREAAKPYDFESMIAKTLSLYERLMRG